MICSRRTRRSICATMCDGGSSAGPSFEIQKFIIFHTKFIILNTNLALRSSHRQPSAHLFIITIIILFVQNRDLESKIVKPCTHGSAASAPGRPKIIIFQGKNPEFLSQNLHFYINKNQQSPPTPPAKFIYFMQTSLFLIHNFLF